MREKIVSVLALFTSVGTLLCCALPALLVTIGLSAVVISAVSAFPWLFPLTKHKEWLFLGAGVLIGLNFMLVYRPQQQVACDVEAGQQGCEVAGRWNKVVLWLSAGVYAVGLLMAYLALPLVKLFEPS
jgi:hypothetical protein